MSASAAKAPPLRPVRDTMAEARELLARAAPPAPNPHARVCRTLFGPLVLIPDRRDSVRGATVKTLAFEGIGVGVKFKLSRAAPGAPWRFDCFSTATSTGLVLARAVGAAAAARLAAEVLVAAAATLGGNEKALVAAEIAFLRGGLQQDRDRIAAVEEEIRRRGAKLAALRSGLRAEQALVEERVAALLAESEAEAPPTP